MEREYLLNNNEDDITVEVNVSTRGIVSTEVVRFITKTNFIIIARSTEPPNANGKGKISQRSVGQSNLMAGNILEAFTLIRLDPVPKAEWPAVFENLVIEYTLRGGAEGGKIFQLEADDKEKSSTGRTIQATKRIKLTLTP